MKKMLVIGWLSEPKSCSTMCDRSWWAHFWARKNRHAHIVRRRRTAGIKNRREHTERQQTGRGGGGGLEEEEEEEEVSCCTEVECFHVLSPRKREPFPAAERNTGDPVGGRKARRPRRAFPRRAVCAPCDYYIYITASSHVPCLYTDRLKSGLDSHVDLFLVSFLMTCLLPAGDVGLPPWAQSGDFPISYPKAEQGNRCDDVLMSFYRAASWGGRL